MREFFKHGKKVIGLMLAIIICVSLALTHLSTVSAETTLEEWNGVSGEWVEENDTLSPTTENAVMQYATKLSGDFKISFDLTLSSKYEATTNFQIALFAKEDDADMAYAYAVNVNSTENYVSVVNNTEYSAALMGMEVMEETLRDDQARNLTIISYQDKLYVSYAGKKIATGKTLTVTEGFLNLSAASIYDKVNNFTYTTSYVPTEEETTNDELLDIRIDFSDNSDVVDFKGIYLNWGLDSTTGSYKGTNWSSCYYTNPLMIVKENVKTVVSFDFKATELINIGIVDDPSAEGKSLVAKVGNATENRYLKVDDKASSVQNTYMTDATKAYADDEWHNFKAEFKNGKAYLYIDNVAFYQGHSVATTPMYLFLQGGNGNAYIDNLSMKENEFILDVPFEENDYQTTSDADFFLKPFGGHWVISDGTDGKGVDGTFHPSNSWNCTAYNQVLDMTQSMRISFDFCLSKPETDVYDNTLQFAVAFATIPESGLPSEALTAYFYNSQQWSTYMTSLNTAWGSPAGGRWIADKVINYFDGIEHTMTITVKDEYVTYAVDGVALFEPTPILSETASFIVYSTDTRHYIDNLEIIKLVDYSKDIDFSSTAHADEFMGGYGNLQVAGGVFKPDRTYATTYMKDAVTLTGSNTIEVDFCVSDLWNVGLVEWVDGGTTGKGLVLFVSNNQVILRDGSTGNDTWIKSQALNYIDSKPHTLSITIKNGNVSFAIDGKMLFEEQSISVDFAHFWTQVAGGYDPTVPVNYIDNLQVLKTIDVTDRVLEEIEVGEKEVLLGYKVVGGRYDGLYPVGKTVESIDGMMMEPVIVDLYMKYGASIRLATEGGIRWTTYFSYEDYQMLQALDIEYALGTLITSPNSSNSVDIPVVLSGFKKDTNFIWHGGLQNIKEANYDRQLLGNGYISLTYTDGTQATIFAVSDENQRSYYQIVQAALNDVESSNTGEYTNLVTDINGNEVYSCYSVEQYNVLKERYNTISNYLNNITE